MSKRRRLESPENQLLVNIAFFSFERLRYYSHFQVERDQLHAEILSLRAELSAYQESMDRLVSERVFQAEASLQEKQVELDEAIVDIMARVIFTDKDIYFLIFF
jgi:cell division septum initiation protein DivIVA